jgi:hypothetical protein
MQLNNNLSSILNMHTEIHKYSKFGSKNSEGVTGYFKDFLSQRLGIYGFPCKSFDNFPFSCSKFYQIIPIVFQKFEL